MRKLPAIVFVAAVLASLSACSSNPFTGSCNPSFPEGSNPGLVEADGRFGKDPKASFPVPLAGSATEVSALTIGDGALVDRGATVTFQATAYNAATGDLFTSSGYDSTSPVLRIAAASADDVLGESLACFTVGSRIVSTTTAATLFTDQNLSDFGMKPDELLVLVLDIEGTYRGKATGADQPAAPGLPTVVLAPNGQPGFIFNSGPAPTELTVEILKLGSGAVVEKGDNVVLHYTGALWDSKTMFSSSWETGYPSIFGAASLDDVEGGLVPGLATALIGQKVGSQVIAVIPPRFGYPAGTSPDTVPADATMIYVFDVLGIK